MKTTIHLIFALFPFLMVGQFSFEATSVEFSTDNYFINTKNMSLNSLHKEDSEFINGFDNPATKVEFSKESVASNFGAYVLVGLKRRAKAKTRSVSQEFSMGLGYRSIKKNAIQFYEESPGGGYGASTIFGAIFLSNSRTNTRTTSYEFQSEIISTEFQEIIWLANGGLINFGIGLRGSLGLEFNSKVVKSDFTGVITRSLLSSGSSSNLVYQEEFKSKNEAFFSGSIPMILSVKFSDNPQKIMGKLHVLGSVLVGFNENFRSDNNRTNFVSLGLGFRYDL